jgi:hypothetical protein
MVTTMTSRWVALAALALLAGAPGGASAADSDFSSALRHLRAGAQAQAEQDLVRYRDGEPDMDMRRRVERILPLLKRPLSADVREYIAATLEETRARGQSRARPSYAARMFPVFP